MIKTFSLDNSNPKWEAPLDGRLSWDPPTAWMMHKGQGEVTSPCPVKAGDVFFVDGDDIHCTFYPNIIR